MKVLLGMCLSAPAMAADPGSCKELFVAPMAVMPPAKKPGGAAWDADSPADPQLTAVPAKRKGARPTVIGPRMDDTEAPRWTSVFVEPGQPGAWLPVRVGDSVALTLTDQDGRSAEVMGRYTVVVPPEVALHGVAYVRPEGPGASEVFLRFSTTDGRRSCAGLQQPVVLDYVLPPRMLLAKVDAAFFARIQQSLRCDERGATAECEARSYTASYTDPNRDGVQDTQVMGGPFGVDKVQVIAVAMGFDPATRKELFVGACEELAPAALTHEVACLHGDKATLLSPLGKGSVRVVPKDEAKALLNHDPEDDPTAEAKLLLRKLHHHQQVLFENQGRYSDNAEELGFSPERGNLYAYLLDPRKEEALVSMTARSVRDRVMPESFEASGCPVTPGTGPKGEPVGLGLSGSGKAQHFIAYAMTNLDDDADLDCWSISDQDRKAKDGALIPAGKPFHERDDVEAPTGR